MENERELLELASKAAGLDAWWSDLFGCMLLRSAGNRKWSPLEHDGDCARMEAALDIDVEWWPEFVRTYRGQDWDVEAQEEFLHHNDDKQAARRMASLRVAAEIGRAMQSDKR